MRQAAAGRRVRDCSYRLEGAAAWDACGPLVMPRCGSRARLQAHLVAHCGIELDDERQLAQRVGRRRNPHLSERIDETSPIRVRLGLVVKTMLLWVDFTTGLGRRSGKPAFEELEPDGILDVLQAEPVRPSQCLRYGFVGVSRVEVAVERRKIRSVTVVPNPHGAETASWA